MRGFTLSLTLLLALPSGTSATGVKRRFGNQARFTDTFSLLSKLNSNPYALNQVFPASAQVSLSQANSGSSAAGGDVAGLGALVGLGGTEAATVGSDAAADAVSDSIKNLFDLPDQASSASAKAAAAKTAPPAKAAAVTPVASAKAAAAKPVAAAKSHHPPSPVAKKAVPAPKIAKVKAALQHPLPAAPVHHAGSVSAKKVAQAMPKPPAAAKKAAPTVAAPKKVHPPAPKAQKAVPAKVAKRSPPRKATAVPAAKVPAAKAEKTSAKKSREAELEAEVTALKAKIATAKPVMPTASPARKAAPPPAATAAKPAAALVSRKPSRSAKAGTATVTHVAAKTAPAAKSPSEGLPAFPAEGAEFQRPTETRAAVVAPEAKTPVARKIAKAAAAPTAHSVKAPEKSTPVAAEVTQTPSPPAAELTMTMVPEMVAHPANSIITEAVAPQYSLFGSVGHFFSSLFFTAPPPAPLPTQAPPPDPDAGRPAFSKQDLDKTATSAHDDGLADVAIADEFARKESEDIAHVDRLKREDRSLRLDAETPNRPSMPAPANFAAHDSGSTHISGFWATLAEEDEDIEQAVAKDGDDLSEYERLRKLQDSKVMSAVGEINSGLRRNKGGGLRRSA